MNVLGHVIRKEFLQLRRDRRMIPVLFVAPMIQLLALGYAANTDVTDVPMVLVDMDRTAASRDLVERFTGSGYFEIVGTEDGAGGIDPWLVTGRAQVALVIRDGYGEAVGAGHTPSVQVIADGTDSNSAVLGLGYASRIVSGVGMERIRAKIEDLARRSAAAGSTAGAARARAASARIDLAPRIWYNPDLKSRWFYVPAILAMTLMLMTLILPSMAVVREKEIGTLEQISVTPIRAWQLIVGKLLPFAVIGVVNLYLVTSLVVFLFGVPLRGTLGSLVLLTLPYLITNLGLGLLVSTIVRNQQQAMMASMFFLMVPMIYLSGLIFPIDNMPQAIQYVTYAIPLRYYVNVIRGVFLKGSGFDVLWPEMITLTGFGLVALTLASMRFRKKLD
jgi:drug efflux transport system permease protein